MRFRIGITSATDNLTLLIFIVFQVVPDVASKNRIQCLVYEGRQLRALRLVYLWPRSVRQRSYDKTATFLAYADVSTEKANRAAELPYSSARPLLTYLQCKNCLQN